MKEWKPIPSSETRPMAYASPPGSLSQTKAVTKRLKRCSPMKPTSNQAGAPGLMAMARGTICRKEAAISTPVATHMDAHEVGGMALPPVGEAADGEDAEGGDHRGGGTRRQRHPEGVVHASPP